MKTNSLAIIAVSTVAMLMGACASLTPAQQQQITADSIKIATAAAAAAATNATQQLNDNGKVDAKKVGVAAASAAVGALPAATPAP